MSPPGLSRDGILNHLQTVCWEYSGSGIQNSVPCWLPPGATWGWSWSPAGVEREGCWQHREGVKVSSRLPRPYLNTQVAWAAEGTVTVPASGSPHGWRVFC